MSRTRKSVGIVEQAVEEDRVAFGSGFEVGRSVRGCYLKKIVVKDIEKNGETYQRVNLSFIKNDRWITKFITFPSKGSCKTEEIYKKARIEAMGSLENLVACYLSSAHMKRVFVQASTFGVHGIVRDITTALTEKRFWDTEICLKTLPENGGGVSIARFTPFMARASGSNWKLSYSPWELNRVSLWYNNKNN